MQLTQRLTQKETTLLKDLKDQEKVCIEKYNKYSQQAHDSQLKDLLSQIGQAEQQHLDTLNQIENGNVPSMQGSQGSQGSQKQKTFSPAYGVASSDTNKKEDAFLCTDLLSTEKHVSSVYNTCIFEFKDTKIRDALNHIQKEEQEHGEQLYSYMSQNGMYS